MTCTRTRRVWLTLFGCFISTTSTAIAADDLADWCAGVEIPVARSQQPHQYKVEVQMHTHLPEEDEPQSVMYAIDLDCTPSAAIKAEEPLVTYTCRRFQVTNKGRRPITLPELKDLTYNFAWPSENMAPAFGLPVAKLVGLRNNRNTGVQGMLVYTAFTDYHVLCNVYAQPIEGGGIQELRAIGQQFKHATANAVTSLAGSPGLEEGSEFRHGEVMIEWKGLSRVNGRSCAIVGFDSGENKNRMVTRPAPSFRLENFGHSHHRGELHIDLESGWVAKASMMEVMVNRRRAGDKKSQPVFTLERNVRIELRE